MTTEYTTYKGVTNGHSRDKYYEASAAGSGLRTSKPEEKSLAGFFLLLVAVLL